MKRQQPLPRKRKKARAYKTPRCKTLRCNRPAKALEWCNTHGLREADRLARKIVMERDGACRLQNVGGVDDAGQGHSRDGVLDTVLDLHGAHADEPKRTPSTLCNGGLQWCHVHSRSYKAIRHDPRNAIVMCAAHHAYFTHHPLEWETWCRDHEIPWDTLRLEALQGAASWSLAETLERLMAA